MSDAGSGIKTTGVDIAKKANVSIGTVDRVLHNRGEVSESTKNKILKIKNNFAIFRL